MTVHTWYTSERPAGQSFRKPEQRIGTRGTYEKCFAIDIEKTSKALFVTVAAGSMKACIAEFHRTAESLGIPAEKWYRFDIPLTKNAIRAVNSWLEAVRVTIRVHREQAAADSSGTL